MLHKSLLASKQPSSFNVHQEEGRTIHNRSARRTFSTNQIVTQRHSQIHGPPILPHTILATYYTAPKLLLSRTQRSTPTSIISPSPHLHLHYIAYLVIQSRTTASRNSLSRSGYGPFEFPPSISSSYPLYGVEYVEYVLQHHTHFAMTTLDLRHIHCA